MTTIFGAPHRYVQGPGVLERLAEWTDPLGARPLLLVDRLVHPLVRPSLAVAYAGKEVPALEFEGEITFASIAAMVERARPFRPDLIVGIGGGKTLDVAKGVARSLGCAVATVPTIASTDAPTSKAIAIYDDSHAMVAVEQMARNPELVLVGTALIARAPARFLRAGIGDAIAKKFEAEAARLAGGTTAHGAAPPLAGLLLAEGCYTTLRTHAEAALAAVEAQRVEPALELVVEACVLLAGLGFENGGLSVAHAMTRGLMAAPSTTRALHGEHVAYGLLVQLVLERRTPAFIADLVGFYGRIGMPATLAALARGPVGEADIALIAERSMTAPHVRNMPHPVAAADMVAAMRGLEAG